MSDEKLPARLREAAEELERWRTAACAGSKEEAWLCEEAWRDAVREAFGPDGYAKVQVVAARLRAERLPMGNPQEAQQR